MPCKGQCISQAVKKQAYSTGVRRCTTCRVYYPETVTRCPCCSQTLRKKPQNNKYRRKYNN